MKMEMWPDDPLIKQVWNEKSPGDMGPEWGKDTRGSEVVRDRVKEREDMLGLND